MKEKELKEELTTAMHSEFTVNAETDLKHKVWAALGESSRNNTDIHDLIDSYGLTMAQVEKYKLSYLDLFK